MKVNRPGGVILLGVLISLAVEADTGVTQSQDPLEPYNRAVYRFNTDFDNAFMRPLAKGYKAITPASVDRGITNFFNNIWDVTSFVNNVLQFKMSRAGSDLGRIFINSTVGALGFFDVATNAGLPSYKEDFGQTLGYWGLKPGAYFMLPIIGPSSIRDTIGFAGDVVTDPFFGVETGQIYWGFAGVRAIDFRADNLDAGDILNDAALDPYVFMRDAYLQRRHNLVYDGNPPDSKGQEDIWADVDFEDGNPASEQRPARSKTSGAGQGTRNP